VSKKKPDIKPLTGKYNGLLRLRVGSYRVIFQLKGGRFLVLVIQIVESGDAYR
jgi:mRNA interferase RelE/StbE